MKGDRKVPCVLCKQESWISGRVKEDTCSKCRYENRSQPAYSREYARAYNLKTKYGLSEDEYDTLLASQDYKCALCFTTEWGKRGPQVDHDHKTGTVRGILCVRCNMGLGYFQDSPGRLYRAAQYLAGVKVPNMKGAI